MAGLTLISKHSGIDVLNAINNNNILTNYFTKIFFRNEDYVLAGNIYEEYPVKTEEYSDCIVIIEGRLYKSAFDLRRIVDTIIKEDREELCSLLKHTDGSFIIYVYKKSDNTFLILNDIFGRLPLFMNTTGKLRVIARGLNLINSIIEKPELDNRAAAEFLHFGFSLGSRTLLNDVIHLPPSVLIKVSDDIVDFKTIHDFNFDYKENSDKEFKFNAENATELFVEAARNRANYHKKNIVTLSGGLDSRLTASALHKADVSFDTVSILRYDNSGGEDVKISKELAEIYNSKWDYFKLDPPAGKDFATLIKLLDGRNSLFMAPMLNFYDKLIQKYTHDVDMFTGDNGDKLMLSVDKPPKKIKDIEILAEYIMNESVTIDPAVTELITGKSRQDIKESLLSRLEDYPERDLYNKYVHFRMLEKPFNSAFHGEDRHRSFIWNVTPFWSIEFFNYVMGCPDIHKSKHRLFKEMLVKLNKQAADKEYTNFRVPVTSLRGCIFINLVYHVYPHFPFNFKNILKKYFFDGNPDINLDSDIRRLLKDINTYRNLDLGDMKPVFAKNLNRYQLLNLVTLFSAVDNFFNGNMYISKNTSTIFY